MLTGTVKEVLNKTNSTTKTANEDQTNATANVQETSESKTNNSNKNRNKNKSKPENKNSSKFNVNDIVSSVINKYTISAKSEPLSFYSNLNIDTNVSTNGLDASASSVDKIITNAAQNSTNTEKVEPMPLASENILETDKVDETPSPAVTKSNTVVDHGPILYKLADTININAKKGVFSCFCFYSAFQMNPSGKLRI